MSNKSYSDLEREVIILAAVWDLIASMVHYSHFEKEHRLEEAMLMFKTREAAKMFIIMLTDLLSLPTDGAFGLKQGRGEGSRDKTYLGELARVAGSPKQMGDAGLLVDATNTFADWLDGSITVEGVWLPTIERNGPLTVRRMTYLKICGNLSKHGFTRLQAIVNKISAVLLENGTKITEGESYQLIPEFKEWFFDHVFIASSTNIAWHLNEIRWGIYRYLRPVWQESYTPTRMIHGLQMYEYAIPPDITNPLVRSMFWELMEGVRSAPYFPRFTCLPITGF